MTVPERTSLRIREFLALVRDAVFEAAPSKQPAFQSRQRFSYLQFYRRDPRVHYEVWPQRRTGRIEVGLHFEGPREFSYAWAQVMTRHADEIMAALGPDVELEEWTPAWTRLHRSLPLDTLTPALARETAAHVLRFMEALEAIVEASWGEVLAASGPALENAGRRRDGAPRRRLRPRGRAWP